MLSASECEERVRNAFALVRGVSEGAFMGKGERDAMTCCVKGSDLVSSNFGSDPIAYCGLVGNDINVEEEVSVGDSQP